MITSLAIVLIASLAGCASSQDSKADATADASPDQPPLRLISMLRTGGIGGFNDRLLISPAGEMATSGPTFGHQRSQLSSEVISQLVRLFEGFDRLEQAYPPPPDVRDDLQYQVAYGGYVVRASMANPELPQQLRQIIQALEMLAAGN